MSNSELDRIGDSIYESYRKMGYALAGRIDEFAPVVGLLARKAAGMVAKKVAVKAGKKVADKVADKTADKATQALTKKPMPKGVGTPEEQEQEM